MNNITRDNISEFINNEFGLAKKDCDDIVNELIEQIITGLINHQIFKIHNFGTFKIKQKNSRIGRNPKTKEEVLISFLVLRTQKYMTRFLATRLEC